MAGEQKTAEVAAIESRIESYLDQNGNTIQLDLSKTSLEFRQHTATLFTAGQDQIAITIGFKEASISKNDSLDTLSSNFDFITLDRLPIPGLTGVPAHWEIYPQTPMSSFSEGVSFESYDAQSQILALRVLTTFFAIYGRVPQKHPIADRASAPGTYLQVRREIQADIKISAKLVFD